MNFNRKHVGPADPFLVKLCKISERCRDASCTKGTSVHMKKVWIKERRNHKACDFATAVGCENFWDLRETGPGNAYRKLNLGLRLRLQNIKMCLALYSQSQGLRRFAMNSMCHISLVVVRVSLAFLVAWGWAMTSWLNLYFLFLVPIALSVFLSRWRLGQFINSNPENCRNFLSQIYQYPKVMKKHHVIQFCF